MKKLFVIALAAMGMVACVQNEIVEVVKSDVIAFDGSHVDNATRAEIDGAEDPSTTINTIQGFNVWGFMNGNGGTLFTGNDVTRSGDNWVYDDVQYWMPNNTYYFAGVSPIDGNWTATNGDTNNLYPVDVIDFENVDGTEDLLYAYATEKTVDDVKTMGKVDMVFNHLLSKVKFTFQNGFATKNVKVDVQNVKMVAPKSASVNVAGDKFAWGTPSTETVTLEFGATEQIDGGVSDAHEAAAERLTIPTDNTYEYEVSFTVVVYQGEEEAFTVTKTSTITGIALEQGKAYNFTAVITPENLDLKPIEFSVEVNNWDEAGDFLFPAYRVSTADELAAALTSTENVIDVILLNDIDLPITSLGTQTPGSGEYKLAGEDTKMLTIDLNGKNLNITTTYWSALGAKNADALFTIKNGTMTSTGNSAGTWNAWDLRFENCNYVFENVNFDKAVALASVGKTVSMKDVTITDTHNTDTYGLWITAEGQTVTLEDCVIDMTPASDGRGIKIDEQYVDAATKAKVTLNVKNLTVASEEKSAILVKSDKGAEINVDGIDISAVAADSTFAVWVDGDSAAHADKVVVNGALCKVEGETTTVVTDDASLAAALAGTDAVILLNGGQYAYFTAKSNVTIKGVNGAKVDAINLNGAENLTLKNITFDAAKAVACYDNKSGGTKRSTANIVSGGTKTGIAIGARNLVIDGCTFNGTFTDGGAAIAFADRSRPTGGSGDVTIKNCTFATEGAYYDVYGYYTGNAGLNFVFENNTFNSNTQSKNIYLGRLKTSEAIVVNGNHFDKKDSLANAVTIQGDGSWTPTLDAADNTFGL